MVWKMWDPLHLTALWASNACNRNSFTSYLSSGVYTLGTDSVVKQQTYYAAWIVLFPSPLILLHTSQESRQNLEFPATNIFTVKCKKDYVQMEMWMSKGTDFYVMWFSNLTCADLVV
jgi:hypothetical protein